MRDFVIMADVNADTTPLFAKQENIAIMPQYYHFNDGVIYGDGNALSTEQFFARLEAGERAYSMGCNPASSDCSGSYNTVCTEADELMSQYRDARIHVVDSRLECAPIGLLIRQAVALKKAGKSFDEVVSISEELKSTANVFFLVDHLDYLVRGGRLSPISGMVGTALGIKPILYGDATGHIVSCASCHGRKKAIHALAAKYHDKRMTIDNPSVYISHGDCLKDAETLRELILRETPDANVVICPHEPFSGAHVGPGMLGLFFLGRER